jgi:2-aminoadipate transaminase
MRLCFASPSHEEINQGVAALAEVCRREFGVQTPGARADGGLKN